MQDSLTIINLMIAVSGLVICILGLIQTILSRQLGVVARRYFIVLFIIMVAYVVSNLLGQLAFLHTGKKWAQMARLGLFAESTFSSLLMPLMTIFILVCSGDKKYIKNRFLGLSISLWMVYFGLLVFTQFSTIIYTINDENVYSRGPLYQLLLVPPVLLLVLNLVVLWFKRSSLNIRQRTGFAVFLISPLIAMLIQMVFYGIYIIMLGTIISAFFMFAYILMDQTEKYYIQESENEKLKAEVLMAQIRPHFIYNSLTAIRSYLDEPEKAEEVLNHFAGFLRGSIDMLEENNCIRADREFDTVDNYLYMEKERFGEKLKVETEYNDRDFLLPPFSVQTLVENAVNHGIRKNKGGRGALRIKSYRTDTDHIIEVKDDGVGFDEASVKKSDEDKDNKKSHIGLANLRKRLALMCEGSLKIESKSGKGTLAVISIPVKQTENKL